MGVIGLTAVEVLATCLGLGLILAILIVVCNCVSTCWEMISHRRKKRNVDKLPDDYVDEIHRLLHRNQKPCDYDCVVVESGRQSVDLEYMTDSRVDPTPPPKPAITPRQKSVDERESMKKSTPCKSIRMESEETINTNTTNSQSTINASEEMDMGKSKRRTWGRLSNSLFYTAMMPSMDTTTTEETTGTACSSIDNLRFGMKIETTV